MKRLFLVAIIFILSFSLFGCMITSLGESEDRGLQKLQTDETNEEAVIALVEKFGKKLQAVSLLSPEEILKDSMQENYADYVSQELLDTWFNDPLNAPGRLTSSPWPERIEILSSEKILENSYEVKGEIIEVTNVEKESNKVTGRQSITLMVEETRDGWLITNTLLYAI